MAAPTFGASATLAHGTSGTTAAMPKPTGIVAGSRLLVLVGREYAGTTAPAAAPLTPPASGGTWTQVGTDQTVPNGGDAIRASLWEYEAAGAESGTWSFTWTGTAAVTYGWALRFDGAATGASMVGSEFAFQLSPAAATAMPAISITTGGADRLLVHGHIAYNGASGYTPPGGFTTRINDINRGASTNPQAVAGSTGSLTASDGNTDRKIVALVGVAPPAPGGPLPPLSKPAGLIRQVTWHARRVFTQAIWSTVAIPETAGGAALTAQVDDLAAPTDLLDRVAGYARAPADNAVPTDALTAVLSSARAPTDNANPTDLVAQASAAAQTIGDLAVPTDQLSYQVAVIVSRSLDDLAVPTDALARALDSSRTIPDNSAPTDLVAQVLAAARALDDPATPTDLASYQVSITAAVADLANPTDQAAQAAALAGSFPELTGPTDLMDEQVAAQRAMADNATPTDQLSFQVTILYQFSELTGPTDAFSQVAAYAAQFPELTGPADQLTQMVDVSRTIPDNAVPTDQPSYILAVITNRSLDDNSVPTDLVARTAAFQRAMAEDAGLAELLDDAHAAFRALADNSAPTDLAAYIRGLNAAPADNANPTDTLARTATIGAVLAEDAGLTDTLARTWLALRAMADDAGPSDEVTGIALAGIVPYWRGRITVLVGGPSRAAGGGPAHVVPTGPTGVRGG